MSNNGNREGQFGVVSIDAITAGIGNAKACSKQML